MTDHTDEVALMPDRDNWDGIPSVQRGGLMDKTGQQQGAFIKFACGCMFILHKFGGPAELVHCVSDRERLREVRKKHNET